jgi:endonuclease/exonuclease/phosphatase family metal-dependent hydrolase
LAIKKEALSLKIKPAVFIILLTIGLLVLFGSASHSESSHLKGILTTNSDPALPLCEEALNPDNADEKVYIHCALERGEFSEASETPQLGRGKTAKVVAYNIERGMEIEKQIMLLAEHPAFKGADIILISEADRGCSRTGKLNVTRHIAQALKMNYVFGVEYVELPRVSKKAVNEVDAVCEHGNATLSRFPITGAELLRHRLTSYSYIPPGPERDHKEPRLGGGMAIAADINADGDPLRVYSLHFDTDPFSKTDIQKSQAEDIIAHAANVDYPVIAGGDLNTVSYINDLRNGGKNDVVVSHFLDNGFADAHAELPVSKRHTSGMSYGAPVIIDIIVTRNARNVEAGVCPKSTCGKLSDHLPVWTVVEWD